MNSLALWFMPRSRYLFFLTDYCIKQDQINEEEFRQGFYNADNTLSKPCTKIENFVRRIYHPTQSELASEDSDLS